MTRLYRSAISRGVTPSASACDRDRRAVLVGAADHEHLVARHPLVAAEDVGGHAEAGDVADVPRAVGVGPGDCGQDVPICHVPRLVSARARRRRAPGSAPRRAPVGSGRWVKTADAGSLTPPPAGTGARIATAQSEAPMTPRVTVASSAVGRHRVGPADADAGARGDPRLRRRGAGEQQLADRNGQGDQAERRHGQRGGVLERQERSRPRAGTRRAPSRRRRRP